MQISIVLVKCLSSWNNGKQENIYSGVGGVKQIKRNAANKWAKMSMVKWKGFNYVYVLTEVCGRYVSARSSHFTLCNESGSPPIQTLF